MERPSTTEQIATRIDSPLFSIVIANYNREKYLSESIVSALSQTYENVEIVFVDDGSTDNSVEIIKDFANKDKRIRFYAAAQNEGCGSAMKKCVDLSNGKWFGFVGSDDVLLPDAVAIMVACHTEYPENSIVCSTHYVCDENLRVERLAYGAMAIPVGESYLSFGKGISSFASFSREYYDQTEGINPGFKRAVDQDIYYKMEEVGKVCFIDKPTYLYRVNPQGISTNRNMSKARYWFVKAKENAYERRLIRPSAKSIKKRELNAWWSILFMTKASDAFSQWKLCLGSYWLFASLSKSTIDRYALLKLRTLFMNSFLHKILWSLRKA